MARVGSFWTTLAVCGLAAVVTAPLAAQSQAPERLSLADAMAAARANNGRLHDADAALDEARLTRDVARAALRPKITPNILGAIGDPELSSQSYGISMSQRLTTGTEFSASVSTAASRNQLGTFYYTDTTLLVTQPIVGGAGRDEIRRDLTTAERRVDAAAAGRQLTEQQLTVDVAKAYYTIVGQLQLVGVAEKARERSAKLLEISRAKLAVGLVSQLDVLRAEQLLRDADARVLDARGEAEDAHDQLALLMGRPLSVPFDVDTDIPVVRETIDVDAAVRRALAGRPDLRSARGALADANRFAAAARRLPVPEFDVKVALTRREAAPTLGASLGAGSFRVVPFIGVSMPTDRSGQRATTLLQQQHARDDVDRLSAQIELDVRRAIRQQDRLAHALENADAAVRFAEVELDVATERFDQGLSNNLDVITAQSGLLAAESRRVDTLAALAVSRLTLEATVGEVDGGSR